MVHRMVDFLRIWMSYYPEDFSTTTFTRLINNITAYKDQLPSGYSLSLSHSLWLLRTIQQLTLLVNVNL